MNLLKWMPVIMALAVVCGCVTVTYPDGRTETRVDVDLAAVALDGAVAAFNLYRDVDADAPEPSRLERLLNDIERAEALYNRLLEQYGQPKVKAVALDDGTMEVVADVVVD